MSNLPINAIIGRREAGKTTFLYSRAVEALRAGIPTMVIDSATEHESKSLLKKLQPVFPAVVIPSPPRSMLLSARRFSLGATCYPFTLKKNVSGAEPALFLVDAAYYLELGYRPGTTERGRERLRRYYKQFAVQAANSFLAFAKTREKTLLLMDEIEMIPPFDKLTEALHGCGCEIWMTLHERAGLGCCAANSREYTMEHYAPKAVERSNEDLR